MMLIKLENHWENESKSVFQSGLPFPRMRVENSISTISSGLVYIEYLIRVLTSNFLLNYLNFGIIFKEWCTKLVQYTSK